MSAETDPPVMHCAGCGMVRPWTPFGRCSWECYDLDRDTQEEQVAMIEEAPEAFAFFMGLAPGERADDEL
jgi:hypothetical protein